MGLNKFQKNPFVKSNQTTAHIPTKFSQYSQLGRKTVEEVKQDMINIKYNDFKGKQERKTEVVNPKPQKDLPDYKRKVSNLRNINKG